MFVENNSVLAFKNYFFEQLKSVYDKGELTQLYVLTFFYAYNWSKVELRMNESSFLSESQLLLLNSVVKRLKKSEPIQHIFEKAEFYDLLFKVNKNVLVPRQETEELVDLILSNCKSGSVSLLDIGTGSGCIPIAINSNNKDIKVKAIDVSVSAIAIARENALANNVQLDLIHQDILALDTLDSLISEKIDIIVSNPPYVTQKEKGLMHKNVLDYDPHLALFVEDIAPLIFYDKIAKLAFDKLEIGGELYFEINEYFGKETKDLVESFGFSNVELIQDLNQKDRIVYAIK